MSDIKMSVCGSCGFQWPTGQHGGHSCSSYLRTENASLKDRIVELEKALTNIKKHQEATIFKMPELSTAWQIASRALEK